MDVLVAMVLILCGLPWYVVLGITWWWTCSPMAFLPIVPATIRMRIGEAISAPQPGADLEQTLDTIERTIEGLVLDAKGDRDQST